MCCPDNNWASTGLRWLGVDADCFGLVDTDRRGHYPVALQWRDRGGHAIGMSRKWTLDDDGSLLGEFFVPPDPVAQVAAELAAHKRVAPSIGFRFEADWVFIDPADWDPVAGRLDICRFVDADLQEVSLTPSPQLATSILSVR
jgi:hypothetical protein